MLRNSLNHIYHLVTPFSIPILFFDIFAPHNKWVCQKIVTGSAGSSAVPGGYRGVGNFSVVAAACLLFECMGCSAWGAEHFDLANHHPSPLYIFTNGAIWSPSTFFCCLLLVPQWHWGSVFHGAVL